MDIFPPGKSLPFDTFVKAKEQLFVLGFNFNYVFQKKIIIFLFLLLPVKRKFRVFVYLG